MFRKKIFKSYNWIIYNVINIRNIHVNATLLSNEVQFQKSFPTTDGLSPARKLFMDPICKVAIVTGGESSLGQASAHALLEAGCRHVVITGINTPGLEKSGDKIAKQLSSKFGNNRCSYHEADILNDHQLETLFMNTRAKHGTPDIIFNNVQCMGDHHWLHTIHLNIAGLIRNNLLALKYMRSGVIVNNAGLAFYSLPTAPVYSGLCHSILYFSVALGDDYNLHQTGVRVVGLATGPFQTKRLLNSEQLTKKRTEDQKHKFESMKNTMRAETIGNALVHLVKYGPSGSGWLIDDGALYLIPKLTKKDFHHVTGFPP